MLTAVPNDEEASKAVACLRVILHGLESRHHAAELEDMQCNPLAEMACHHQHHFKQDADQSAALEDFAVD